MKINNLSIGVRSGLGFAIILSFLAAIMLLGIFNMGKIYDQLNQIYNQNYARIELANEMKNHMDNIYIEMRSVLLLPEQDAKQEVLQRIADHRTQYGKALDNLIKLDQTDEGKKLIANLQDGIASAKESNNQWMELALVNDSKQAVVLMQEECEPKRLMIEKLLYDVINYQESRMQFRFDEANQNYDSARIIMLILGLVAVVLGVFIAAFLTRSISRPIAGLVKAAETVAGGDLTVKIPVNSKDEIGKLAAACVVMINNTRDLVSEITAKALTVSSSSQQLNLNAQQTASTANEAAATMGEIATAVTQVASNIQNVSASSFQANEHATQGREGIQRVTSQMQKIAESAEGVAGGIDGLSRKSQEITQIVELITSIADQTNLLALNAAIEAGRAGEQGRGFAVVAEEVRKLAEQSAQAAKEIKTLINSIQDESQRSVESMADSGREVDNGTRVVVEVGESFNQIINAVQSLTTQVQEAASATQQTSAGVQQVAATTEEQTAAMEEVSASAETLSALAEELNSMVKRFKT